MKKIAICGGGLSSLALAIATTLADSGIELIEATTEQMGELSQNNRELISMPILPQPKLIYDFK